MSYLALAAVRGTTHRSQGLQTVVIYGACYDAPLTGLRRLLETLSMVGCVISQSVSQSVSQSCYGGLAVMCG